MGRVARPRGPGEEISAAMVAGKVAHVLVREGCRRKRKRHMEVYSKVFGLLDRWCMTPPLVDPQLIYLAFFFFLYRLSDLITRL